MQSKYGRNKTELFEYNLRNLNSIEIENECIENAEDINSIVRAYSDHNDKIRSENMDAFVEAASSKCFDRETYSLIKDLGGIRSPVEEEFVWNDDLCIWNYMTLYATTRDLTVLERVNKENNELCDAYLVLSVLTNNIPAESIPFKNALVELFQNSKKRMDASKHKYDLCKMFNTDQLYNFSDLEKFKVELCQVNTKEIDLDLVSVCEICKYDGFYGYTTKSGRNKQRFLGETETQEECAIDLEKLITSFEECVKKANWKDVLFIAKHYNRHKDDSIQRKLFKMLIYCDVREKPFLEAVEFVSNGIEYKIINFLEKTRENKNIVELCGIAMKNESCVVNAFGILYTLYKNENYDPLTIRDVLVANMINVYKNIDEIIRFYTKQEDERRGLVKNSLYSIEQIEAFYNNLSSMLDWNTFVEDNMETVYYNWYSKLQSKMESVKSGLMKNVNNTVHNKYKYAITARNIIENKQKTTTESVEAFVILVLGGYFDTTKLSRFYKPNVNEFIKNNIGKIMYYTKKIYNGRMEVMNRLGVVDRGICIYETLFFIIRAFDSMMLGVMIEYLYPMLEHFLKNNRCKCRSGFASYAGIDITHKSYEALCEELGIEVKYDLCNHIQTNSNELWLNKLNLHRNRFNFTGADSQVLKYAIENSSKFTELYDSKLQTILGCMSCCKKKHQIQKYALMYEHILNNFLLRAEYQENVEIYLFVLQEYTKHYNDIMHKKLQLEPTDNLKKAKVRNTIPFFVLSHQLTTSKYKYTGNIEEEYRIHFSEMEFTGKDVLRCFHMLLYQNLGSDYEFMKYLILLDDTIVEEGIYKMIEEIIERNKPEYDENKKLKSAKTILINDIPHDLIDILLNTNIFNLISHILLRLRCFISLISHDKYIELGIREKGYYEIIQGIEQKVAEDVQQHGMVQSKRTKGRQTFFNNSPATSSTETPSKITDMPYFQIKHKSFSKIKQKYGVDLIFSYYNLNDISKCYLIEDDEYSLISIKTKGVIENNKNVALTICDQVMRSEAEQIDQKIEYYTSNKEIEETNRFLVERHVKSDRAFLNESDHKIVQLLISRMEKSRFKNLLVAEHYKLMNLESDHSKWTEFITLEYIRILKQKKRYQEIHEIINNLILNSRHHILYEYAILKVEENKKEEGIRALMKLINCDPENKAAIVKRCELLDSKKEFIKSIEKLNSINLNEIESEKQPPKTNTDLIKLYYLYAKYNDRSNNTIHAIFYYYKSFGYNYESVPKFIHLINQISNFSVTEAVGVDVEFLLNKKSPTIKDKNAVLNTILQEIIRSKLPQFVNYYQHLLTNHKNAFIKQIIQEMIRKYSGLLWRTILYFNSRRTFSVELDTIGIYRQNITKLAYTFIDIAKSTKTDLSMKQDFPGISKFIQGDIHVPGQIDDIFISDFDDEIATYRSLQKPKRIGLRGTNGVKYQFVLKNKDDLRRDARFMDLSRLINKMLLDPSKSIVTYDVIPLTDSAGIISYIPDLISFKSIILGYHNETAVNSPLTKFIKKKKMDRNGMVRAMNDLPPVFMRHFLSCFSTSAEYYGAIDSFTKSTAVMNVLGWFMGLGDRHTENILIQNGTNRVVHVDLNMIFESGRKLTIPERVPFRLTQNVVDGFGFLQLKEYRNVAVGVMRMLYSHRDTIISNLLSFVYDPIIKESKQIGIQSAKGSNDAIAQGILDNLREKLSDSKGVEERTDEIINDAQDIGNLSEMYIGWMGYL
ncbi:ATR [Enterospora canceri]|uniref:ATR n=1 Tax=Enterospora canceri TaxID=1081671 RepID=A0A1Y1S6M9_9MICR|nr:ATR [Enterospora canceri]